MRSLRAFIASRRGNVAVLFGLLAVPVIGLTGAAIDYSLAARDRSAMQEAIIFGALAGSRLLGVQSEAQARATAERMSGPTCLRGCKACRSTSNW